MAPNGFPASGGIEALDDHRSEFDAPPGRGDAVAQLEIIGEVIGQSTEPPDAFQRGAAKEHGGTEGEIHRSQRPRLQHLAPEVGIHGGGLPFHGGVGWIGQPIETVDQGHAIVLERQHHLGEQVRRRQDVGVAHQHQVVGDQTLGLRQFGDLGIGPHEFRKNQQPGVAMGMRCDEALHQRHHGIVGVGHHEEVLQGTNIVLREPTRQATFRVIGIAALEGLEEGDAWGESGIGAPPMQRKTLRRDELPGDDAKAQDGQSRWDPNGQWRHHGVLGCIRGVLRVEASTGGAANDVTPTAAAEALGQPFNQFAHQTGAFVHQTGVHLHQ